ncbi:MAG: hypothetical protein ACOCQR_00080 [bacterium]
MILFNWNVVLVLVGALLFLGVADRYILYQASKQDKAWKQKERELTSQFEQSEEKEQIV